MGKKLKGLLEIARERLLEIKNERLLGLAR